MPKSNGISGKQAIAVELLAQGRTATEVASTIGIARQTVSTWWNHNAAFKAAVEAAREDIISGTRMASISTHGAILQSIAELAREGSPKDRREVIRLYYKLAVRPEDIERFNNPQSPEDALITQVLKAGNRDSLN